MDYYSILGIDKGASKEEIKVAHENQVNKIKNEIEDEKRASKFIRLFDEAYESLMRLEEGLNDIGIEDRTIIIDKNKIVEEIDYDETLIINQCELQKELEKEYEIKSNKIEKDKLFRRSRRRGKNHRTRRRKKQRRKNSAKDVKNVSGTRRRKNKNSAFDTIKGTSKGAFNIFMIPIKIILIPIIWLLSLIICICKGLNIVSWILSKAIIVGSIGMGAIHLYQINLGQPKDIKFLIFLVLGIIVSIFLPSILKCVPKVLMRVNNLLKNIVF